MTAKIPASPIPLSASRALALYTQKLHAPPRQPASKDDIYNIVEQLGCVQIDTLHVVARSHYLVLWSRLGQYNPADFDALLFDPQDRRLFEYWKKAASIIPLKDYRYSLPKMRHHRENPGKWWRSHLLQDETGRRLLAHVRERITREGGLRTSDFEYDGPKRGSWWDWKPAKNALEYYYNVGDLMIADRVKFQRVYDLRERVLPDWVEQQEPDAAEADRFHIEQAVRALGICEPMQAAEYAYMGRGKVRPIIDALLADKVLIPVDGELASGDTTTLVIHRDRLPDLQRALDGEIQPQHTTFLSFFDSLFWARGRDEGFWNYRNLLEAYKREPDRIWGYFCLSILHRDRLVGRFDPKVERKSGTLYLRALHLEPGIEPDDELVNDVAAAMRDFMAFHKAKNLVIEPKGHAEFRRRLLAHF